MSDLDALLAGIVANPHEHVRWLIVADWLDDHGFADRAELLRLHRMLLDTCCEPDAHPEREGIHARMMELLRAGVKPCVPQHTLTLPGGVPLVAHFIPPGSFRMGSPESEAERSDSETPHVVTLTNGFWLGTTAVRQAQWAALIEVNPSHFVGKTHPVETVDWGDADAFCGRLSERIGATVRLPTEAEWEYACRAGTDTPFYWGGALNGTQANCNGRYPYGTEKPGLHLETTFPVGSYAAEWPHPWGLADLHGNVWEWCTDWYDAGFYGRAPVSDPVRGGRGRTYRVLRGGSWFEAARDCRAAHRGYLEPTSQFINVGFRAAFTLG